MPEFIEWVYVYRPVGEADIPRRGALSQRARGKGKRRESRGIACALGQQTRPRRRYMVDGRVRTAVPARAAGKKRPARQRQPDTARHDLVLRLDRGLLCIQDPGLSAAHAGHRSGKVRIFRGG
uniref:hypothetical protein n=1 Tax=Sphingomonas bacterium TaxID=1895847 RepID=UPI00260AFB52|nr:hypothetical protein [Sphingomonas bacterium]